MSHLHDLFFCPFLLIFTGLLAWKIGAVLNLNAKLSLFLCGWHTFFCIGYWFFSKYSIADANLYYVNALNGVFDWSPGTKSVESFAALFASGLSLGKLNVFLIFNLFGTIGLLILANLMLTYWPTGFIAYVPFLLLLLPGLSFWSSAIGKDAPSFFAVCLASYSFLDIRRKQGFFYLAVLIMFAVRPHVAGFMVLAAGISILSGRAIGIKSRLIVLSMLVAVGVASFHFILQFVGLGTELSTQVMNEYFEQRQGYNMDGGGSVDISSLPLSFKMFTYLFRPLFIDAPNLLGIAASFENTILLMCVLSVFCSRKKIYTVIESSLATRYNLTFFFIGLYVFSMTTANLGIAVRQKYMIIPSLFSLMAFAANQYNRKVQNV